LDLGYWQDLHSLMYICTCSVLMSCLPFCWLLEEYKWELSKDTFLVQFFSQLYTWEKWIKIPLLFITTVFHRALASCLLQQKDRVKIPLLFITTVFHRALASCLLQQKDRVVFMAQEY
jgi:hypothetical protein